MSGALGNILYVSHTADLRGSAMSLRELMVNIDHNRWHPYALLSKHGPLEDVLSQTGIPFKVLTERGPLNLSRITAARDYMRRHSIDLVHLNSAVPFCRDIGIAARLAGIPIFWHIREDPHSKRVRRLSPWVRWLARKIIVVSSDLEAAFRTSGKVVKVYNGINLERFSPHGDQGDWRAKLGIDTTDFVFIAVGTIEERKGQHLIVDALGRLHDAGVACHVIFVGSPLTETDQQRIDTALARHPASAERCHFVGRQSEVALLLRSADCLLLPSSWEGFPRTVAEAMACGLPVIATRVGELPTMVRHGIDGLLIPAGDVCTLTTAMQELIGRADRQAMGQHARQQASHWSTSAHVDNITSLYAGVLTPDGNYPPHAPETPDKKVLPR